MSTVIKNTLRLGPRDVDTLMQQAQDWQRKVRGLFKTDMTVLAVSHATLAIDGATLSGDTLPEHAFRSAFDDIRARRDAITASRQRDAEVDFDFEIILFRDGAEWFAKAHTEQETWIEQWKNHFGGTCFDYWNNTDSPDDIDDAEWVLREHPWDRMVGSHAPSERGFGLYANTAPFLPSLRDFIDRQPGLQDRARKFALERLRDARFQIDPEQSFSDITRQLFAFSDWTKTDEGKAELANSTAEIAAVLKPSLTLEDYAFRA
jgi:hypothetical protein